MEKLTYAEQAQVHEVSQISGVSIRTLHHYDALGLLCPRRDAASRYRRYTQADLGRLQRILLFRELGVPLKDIGHLLADERQPAETLRLHRQLLLHRIEELHAMVRLVDRTLQSMKGDVAMNPESQFQPLSRKELLDRQRGYEAEVAQRYDPTLVQESQRRAKGYDEKAWAAIQIQQRQIEEQLSRYVQAGLDVGSDPVQAAVAAYQAWIDRHFYPCNDDILAGLGALYTADARFTAHYEAISPGLADYFSRAIAEYCRRRPQPHP